MGLLSGHLGLKKLAFLQERDDWLSAASNPSTICDLRLTRSAGPRLQNPPIRCIRILNRPNESSRVRAASLKVDFSNYWETVGQTELVLAASRCSKRGVMGRVIPFHISDGFKPRAKVKEVTQREAGKVIEFRPAEAKKLA